MSGCAVAGSVVGQCRRRLLPLSGSKCGPRGLALAPWYIETAPLLTTRTRPAFSTTRSPIQARRRSMPSPPATHWRTAALTTQLRGRSPWTAGGLMASEPSRQPMRAILLQWIVACAKRNGVIGLAAATGGKRLARSSRGSPSPESMCMRCFAVSVSI